MQNNRTLRADAEDISHASAMAPNGNLPAVRVDEDHETLLHQDPTLEIINSMEQGVLVWSKSGLCEMYNDRIFEVLELGSDDLYKGKARADFLELSVKRREITQECATKAKKKFQNSLPFSFDRHLPSGRVVATMARPMNSGSFVVTFTDVTSARNNEFELAKAKSRAEDAEQKAKEALQAEKFQKNEMRLLSELDEWLQCCKSMDELFNIVREFMKHLFPSSSGELYIYSNSRDILDGVCHWNDAISLEHIQPDACWALRRGRPYSYGTGAIAFLCPHLEERSPNRDEFQYLCIPIVAHGDTVGLLHIKFCQNESSTSKNDSNSFLDTYQFAIQCAEHISLAIANARLRDELQDQSTKDPLTGLYNRRYFLEQMRLELMRAERKNCQTGLISIDADHFKKFNDNHGHDAGDMVLRTIGDTMMSTLTNAAVPCRFGGEEFAILLPKTSIDETIQAAECLRRAVENIKFRYGNSELPTITLSMGIAAYPECASLPQELIKAADTALYAAKNRGRNQICIAGREGITKSEIEAG